jgi:hypothetical protein
MREIKNLIGRSFRQEETNMHSFTKVIISIVSVGLISWGSIVGHAEWTAHQQVREAHRLKDAIHNELITALETINEPLGFCGTPKMWAIDKAQTITGLGYDEVIEMAANYARYNGVPVHAYDEEELTLLIKK